MGQTFSLISSILLEVLYCLIAHIRFQEFSSLKWYSNLLWVKNCPVQTIFCEWKKIPNSAALIAFQMLLEIINFWLNLPWILNFCQLFIQTRLFSVKSRHTTLLDLIIEASRAQNQMVWQKNSFHCKINPICLIFDVELY